MKALAIGLAIAVACPVAPASARERLLTPTSDWTLEAGDEKCALIRDFKDPQGLPIKLYLQTYGNLSQFKVWLIGDGVPLRDKQRGLGFIRFRFKPDGEWREGAGMTGFSSGADTMTFPAKWGDAAPLPHEGAGAQVERPAWFTFDAVRAAQIEQLAVAFPARDDTVLQIGSLAEQMERLADCTRDLVRKWGYDPEVLSTVGTQPHLMTGEKIAAGVWSSWVKGQLGRSDAIQLRIDVDETGAPSGCVVQHPVSNKEVAERACTLVLKEARFAPATTDQGKPVRAPFVTALSFGVR